MKKKQPVWVLIFAMALAATCAVIIAPALTQIRAYFNVSNSTSQQLIAIFLLGYAISQLISGPISNTYGRKKTLLLGLIVGFFGIIISLVAIYIHSFELLYVSRGLAGIGTAAGVTLSMTIINESFDAVQARKVMAFCVASFALAPGISSCIGGIITQFVGFEFCFVFMAVLAIFCCIITLKLSETLPIERRVKLSLKIMLQSYFLAFKNSKVIFSSLVYGLPVACIYLIATLAPFIAILNFKISPSICGILIFTSYVGYFVGSLIPKFLNTKFKPMTVVFIGTIFTTIISALLLGCTLFGFLNVYTLFILTFLFFLGNPLIFVNLSVFGISSHFDKATASSVFMFIVILMSYLVLAITGKIHGEFEMVLAFACFGASLLAFLIFQICLKKNTT
ncbi:MAG: MFS transporter [Fusobacteria bacterium]|nr:MFS transporter [Fusobacteriota bacterium]